MSAAEFRRTIAELERQLAERTDDLQESLEYQTAISDVLKVISRSTSDLQPVLDTLCETATRLCDAEVGHVAIRMGDTYRHVATLSAEPEWNAVVRDRSFLPGRGTVAGRVVLEGKVIHVADLAVDSEYSLPEAVTLGKLRTVLGVPLLRGGVPIGVITLGRQRVESFTERQIALVRTFADQAVIAIENTRLFTEVQAKTRDLQESLDYQSATSDVLKVISRPTFDLQKVFDTLLGAAMRLCGSGMAGLAVRQGEGYRYVATIGLVPEFDAVLRSKLFAPGRESVVPRTVLARSVVHILDAAADPEYKMPETVSVGKIRTLLGVPLLREGEVIGVIALTHHEVKPFTERQIELVRTFADQAVIAMENARLITETREALDQQTATADVLKVISRSAFDLQAVLDTLTASAAELCEAEQGTIYLREGEVYHAQATFGSDPAVLAFLKSNPRGLGDKSMVPRVARSGKIEHIPDVELDPDFEYPGLAAVAKPRTILGVPLLREGKVEGVFILNRHQPSPFTQRQIDLVQTFADQAVIAIENARLFEQVQAKTSELTRSLEDLRAAQDRLIQSEKMASLGQLTAGIAHEIKNPLNFVNNFASLSSELLGELKEIVATAADGADEAARADLEDIVATLDANLAKIGEHGRRADGIVKSMLLHSRGGSGEAQEADLNALIEEALALAYHGLRAQDKSFNITMERDLDPEVGSITAVPQDLTRVFLNLFGNGFYAANKRKRDGAGPEFSPLLKVATRSLGDTIEIRVRDNGIGIPDEIRAKLFTPFFTTKPTGEGTGLGLSISYDIVTRGHGGSIDVESRVGTYTEFVLRLPRRMRHAEKTSAKESRR